MNERGKKERRRAVIWNTEQSPDEASQQSTKGDRKKGAAKTRIGRTHETPIEAYQFQAGFLDERLGETASLSSVPRKELVLFIVVIALVFRF